MLHTDEDRENGLSDFLATPKRTGNGANLGKTAVTWLDRKGKALFTIGT
ncbi:MAG: hypothetical protein IKN64_09395 [Desulfovibrio sp.]|nr:hypothetical protein [Desulfovibrio sp.]